MAAERVVQVPYEVVPVVLGQRHEGAAHHDELHLVHAVPQLLQLVNTVLRLEVRVVPGKREKEGDARLGFN